ncbi:MAG: hypothetical protein Roseis2KO_09530 [Roseivirga sp.]
MVESIGRYMRWQDRHSSLFGKLLLKKGLAHFGEQPNQLQNKLVTKYGRPYLPIDIDFNISHSGSYVVCAFSQSTTVGIDIEYIKETIDITDFNSVLTPAEYAGLEKSEQQARDFFDYWCRKESIIKVDGRGFSAPVLSIELQQDQALLEGHTYYLKEIQLSAEYKVYIAQGKPIGEVKLVECEF